MIQVETDIASKMLKQEKYETDYYTHDVVDAKIPKNWSNTPDNEPSDQTEQEQPTPT